MKIQPIDVDSHTGVPVPVRPEPAKPVLKSRLKRLFDRQLPSVLRISSADKTTIDGGETTYGGATATEFEPTSVCLAKMVQNYFEDYEKPPQPSFRGSGRQRCNCFNGNSNDSSDDEFDVFGNGGGTEPPISNGISGDAHDILKSLIPCTSVAERNLLADTAGILDKNKHHKRKDDLRAILTLGLSSLGYDSSICKSKWDKSPSFPAGDYEYTDVILEGQRVLVDIDFRSEFEIAISTGAYEAILQSLPYIFVGKPERLGQIVTIVSEAARQSMKKKGMHFPPWRKAEYMRSKWLSPCYTRQNDTVARTGTGNDKNECLESDDCGELELIFGEKNSSPESNSGENEEEMEVEVVVTWQPPAVKPKRVERGAKVVTGLASLLKEKP